MVWAIQFRLPWDVDPAPARPRAVAPPRIVDVAGQAWPVVIVRHRRARRYVLRMTSAGALRLTVPRSASIDGGLRFIRAQAAWITREHTRRSVNEARWVSGQQVRLRGEWVPLIINADGVRIGDDPWVGRLDGDVRAVVESRLRALALDALPARCLALADRHGETVTRVSIRNQRSRWGSCSTAGTIALNWRLIQMPASVADYVMLHELMHLRQPNHSRAFWREVAAVCSDWRESERWLRTHGKELL